MTTDNVNIRVNVDANNATTNLRNVENALGEVGKGAKMANFAIANISALFATLAAAATAIVTEMNKVSLSMTQISASTKISLSTVVGFGKAVSSLGGDSQQAVEGLKEFVAKLYDARKGNGDIQTSLRQVGISLSDLGKLSDEQLFEKYLIGLDKLKDKSKQARNSTDMLGDTFGAIDISSVVAQLNKSRETGKIDTAPIIAASKAQENMNIQWEKTKDILLTIAQPINEFLSTVKITKEGIEEFITVLKVLAAVFISLTIAKYAFAFAELAVSIATVTTAASGAGVALATLLPRTAALITMTSTGGALAVAGTGFWTSMAGAATVLAGILSGVAEIAAIMAIIALAWYGLSKIETAFFNTDHLDRWGKAFIQWIKDAGDAMTKFWRKEFSFFGLVNSEEQNKAEAKLSKAEKASGEALANASQYETYKKAHPDIKPNVVPVVNANRGVGLAAKQMLEDYRSSNALELVSLRNQNALIGLSEEEKQVRQATQNVTSTYIAKINEATKKYVDMKAAAAVGDDNERESFAAYASAYGKLIEGIKKGYNEQITSVTQVVQESISLNQKETIRLNILKQINDTYDQSIISIKELQNLRVGYKQEKKDVEFNLSLSKMSPYEKQVATIVNDNAKALQDKIAIAREKVANIPQPDGLEMTYVAPTDAQRTAYSELHATMKEATDTQNQIQTKQLADLEYSRTWEAGWKGAFDNYLANATNAATMAGEVFNSITGNMNSAIDNFVMTGKFSFSDFAKSVIQDLVKIELKMMASQALRGFMPGIGGFLGSLMGIPGSGAGVISGGSGISAGAGISGSGFSLGSASFGGGFATGGQPPMNKISMVGERGPELFIPRSAGTIIPNDKLGGGNSAPVINNITNNTYQVSAIDAKSVAQLFAENRKTLLGTVRAAEREMPYR